ncbi:16S rRNA (guanine(527)-N(7))-methyltransferase RsmG [Ignavigranum ruoffiae]|uniref:16S rRNA (guanine(527)-N(7))-methyltransferase RsmG n=1 Tax=Ignavigranum ruoffiae TaxID=89093 RepID=UPI00206F173E|nr:16S rRNA (guanine(527)-N(7))-methyltransferase RsmG [Ignavigranum ruoffiae]UPQ86399.1 16S rRNA (guanine(527)-N(7))-methyltransferase RsmG [Ignavigranum ruoffiae]
MNEEKFIQALAEKNIQLSEKQLQQFDRYFSLLVEWNQKINLTAITEHDEVYLKHFYDSLVPLWWVEIPEAAKVVDVGAGAGFPSIPIKIIRPDIQLTIIDSLNKRINFLNELVADLGLTGVKAVHARAEEAGQDQAYRGQYDLATARAVASLNILVELCLPFVKKGGHFIALKGQDAHNELIEAKRAITLLGGKFEAEFHETLPQEESYRAIIDIRKTLDTPNKYPRRPGKPNKQPL